MEKINILKPDKNNLKFYVSIGILFLTISFLDVFFNSVFEVNITSFFPDIISFFVPLFLGYFGLYFIRIEYSGNT